MEYTITPRRIFLSGILALGLLAAGFGIGYAVFELGDGDDGANTFPRAYCRDAADWHAAQILFLARVAEPESREGDGLLETSQLFRDATEDVVPVERLESDEDIRIALSRAVVVLRRTLRVEEEWLFELGILDILASQEAENPTTLQIDAVRRVGAKRLELNELLREASALLRDGCGLEPLNVTTEAQTVRQLIYKR